MRAIVLAGGLGTRLRARVPDLPKVMAPVGGRPFLEHVLDRLIAGGIENVILSLSYKAAMVTNHFGPMYKGVALSYAIEEQPLGTGGAVVYALKNRGAAPALVLNGDTLLDMDYGEFVVWYARMPTRVAMVLRKMPDVARYGTVLASQGVVTGFAEKGKTGPGLINAGVYVVRPEVFESYGLSGKFSFETDLLQPHCRMLRPRAYITDAYFIDIGVPEDYERAQSELRQGA